MKLCARCGQPVNHFSEPCPSCSFAPKKLGGHYAFAPELAEQSEGFEPDYFARLAQLEAGNFWFRSRNQLLVWAIKRYFPHASTFLEIGCGTGFVLSAIERELPDVTFSGSEIFTEGLVFAAQRLPRVELFQMDARHIPFRDEFDVIGAFDVLEHIKDDEAVLSQMFQAVRSGGGILLTVPHHPFLYSQVDDYARHVRRYRTEELKAKVRRAGFKIVRVTSFVSVLMPLLMVSRLVNRSRTDFDPEAEFKIGHFANKTLEKTLDAERSLIRAGVSFPFGGSLLVVGNRD